MPSSRPGDAGMQVAGGGVGYRSRGVQRGRGFVTISSFRFSRQVALVLCAISNAVQGGGREGRVGCFTQAVAVLRWSNLRGNTSGKRHLCPCPPTPKNGVYWRQVQDDRYWCNVWPV